MERSSYLDILTKLTAQHSQFERAVDYAMELLALHMDFDWILDALENLYADVTIFDRPQSPLAVIRKRFILTHFEDDFCYRVYSFREKVFQFLNAVFCYELDEKDPKQRDKILDRLTQDGATELTSVLGFFSQDEAVRNMLGRRAALVHRLSLRDIRELSQAYRYFEWLSWNPDLDKLGERDETDVAISSFQLDETKKQFNARLSQTTQDLKEFGQSFCEALLTVLPRRNHA